MAIVLSFSNSTGYDTFIIARPILYSMLLRQIPLHKIHMGKKVLGLQQNESGVTLFCSDNRSYFGDLLIGADGTSSIVRTNMYTQMKSRDILPLVDEAEMRYTCECLVGQTKALDSRLFPELKQDTCILNTIVGYDGPYKVKKNQDSMWPLKVQKRFLTLNHFLLFAS